MPALVSPVGHVSCANISRNGFIMYLGTREQNICKLQLRGKVRGVGNRIDIHAFGAEHPTINTVSKLVDTL